MPYESSEVSSNQPDGPLGSQTRPDQTALKGVSLEGSHEIPKPRYIPNRRYCMFFKIFYTYHTHKKRYIADITTNRRYRMFCDIPKPNRIQKSHGCSRENCFRYNSTGYIAPLHSPEYISRTNLAQFGLVICLVYQVATVA